MFSFSLAKNLGMTAGCLLTGKFEGIPYRELLHWMAFSKIERDQAERESLARTAKSNLPHYHRRA